MAAGRDGRGELPPTLRDALILRVEALPEAAQELLRVVAAGQRVDHDVLREVSGVDGRPLREALREAVAHGLLVADEDGRYAFRHALLREAVVDDLLPGEQTELHLELAEAIERRVAAGAGGRDGAAEVAHHFAEAGDRPRAFGGGAARGDDAEGVHANGEAAVLLERALELWPQLPDAVDLAGCDHVDLLRRAARAHTRSGELEPGARPAARGARRARRRGRPAAGRGAAGADWAARCGASARAPRRWPRTTAALALLPPGEPSVERAQVLAAQGRAFMLAERFAEGAERCREAIDAARAADSPAMEGDALNSLGVCQAGLGDLEAGEAALRRSIEIGREIDDPDAVHRGFSNLVDALLMAGQAQRAREVALEGLEELTTSGQVRWLTLTLAEIEFRLGEWDSAEAHAPAEDVARTGGDTRMNFLLRRSEVLLGRGDVDAAVALLEDAHERSAQLARAAVARAGRGACWPRRTGRRRRFDDARTAVRCGLDRLAGDRTRVGAVAAAGGGRRGRRRAAGPRPRPARGRGRGASRNAEAMAALAAEAAAAPNAVARPRVHVFAAVAAAEAARAAGRPDPAAWAAVAARWDELSEPYRGRARQVARGRGPRAGRRPRRRAGGRRARARGRGAPRRALAARRARDARPPRAPAARRRRRRSTATRRTAAAGAGRRARPDRPRARGPRPPRRGPHEPRDRRGALHGREDRERPRLADPREARRAQPDGGGRRRAPARPGA